MEEESEEYHQDEEYEEPPRKNEKKKKSKMMPILIIGIIVIVVVVVLLIIMGLGSGIDDISVTATPYDESDAINIIVTTHTSGLFGASPSGDVDLKIEYSNGSGDVYDDKVKISGGGGNIKLPIEEFYVDNGEYLVSISYEGKTSEDIVNIDKTVKAIIVNAYDEEDKEGIEVTFDMGISKDLDTDYNTEILENHIDSPIGNGTLRIKYTDDNETYENVFNITFSIVSRQITWENGNTETIGVTDNKLLVKYEDFYQEKGTYIGYVEFTNSVGDDKTTYSADDINPEYLDRDEE